jgi:endoglucanase Acf2
MYYRLVIMTGVSYFMKKTKIPVIDLVPRPTITSTLTALVLLVAASNQGLAQNQQLKLGPALAQVRPQAVSGFNFGNMMDIVGNRQALLQLSPSILRFPAGNVGDDQDLNVSSLKIFAINLAQLSQNGIVPQVIMQTRAFGGARKDGKNQASDAAFAARWLVDNKLRVDYWSVGNEPNLYAVTRGDASWTVEKYCQTFKEQRQAILAVQPDAKFAGPSSTGDAAFLARFVELCGDQIQVLTWHVYPTDGRASDEAALASIERIDREREQYLALWRDPAKNPLAYQNPIEFGLTEYGLSWRTESSRHIGDQVAALWAAEATLRMASAGAVFNSYFALQGIGPHGTLDISGVPRGSYYAFRHLKHFTGQAIDLQLDSNNSNNNQSKLWLHAAEDQGRLTVIAINPAVGEQALPTGLPGWQLIGVKGFSDATVQAEANDLALALKPQLTLPGRSLWRLVYQKATTALQPSVNLATVWREGNFRAPVAPIFKTSNLAAPYASNAWWGSLLQEPYSGALMAQPLALMAQANGMALNYPSVVANEDGFATAFSADIVVGLPKVSFAAANVDAASDFLVRAEFKTGNQTLYSTFGRGLPYAWFRASQNKQNNQALSLTFSQTPSIWAQPCQGIPCQSLGVRVAGRDYLLLAAPNAQWSGSGASRSVTGGALTVAALPEEAQQDPSLRLPAAQFLLAHASALPSDSQVAWRWLRPLGLVETTHRLTVAAGQVPVMGLYPHQWKNTDLALTNWSYQSARGQIKLAETSSFVTHTRYSGILPNLPLSPLAEAQAGVRAALLEYVAKKRFFPLSPESIRLTDAYTDARNFGRLVQMLEVAEQLGEREAAQTLLAALRERLDEWLDPAPPHGLLWDGRWGTIIPVPASHGVDYQLNDHHFNFGYFLQAAASIAERDPAWLVRQRPLLDVLAREIAAGAGDPSFVAARNFDGYAGHSWASGDNRGRLRGANQESSSEAINAWAGLIRYGEVSDNPALLERAVGMYALETNAIWQYWFAAGGNFPPAYPHTAVGIVWGDGGQYGTWWTGAKGAIHLINALPLTGASLYLAREPGFIAKNFAAFKDQRYWNDLAALYLALSDPAAGQAAWDSSLPPEFGHSVTQTQHWLTSLAAFGTPVQRITADVAQFAIFERQNQRTYLAYNPHSSPQIATFSDATVLELPPHRYAQKTITINEVKP